MTTRRSFLGGLARGAGGLASFRAGALGSVLAAGRAVTGRSPEEVAADEDYWREIQQAFTVDRTLINLNNGGVSPSPRVVQEAMRRYLELSNEAPAYTMWQRRERVVLKTLSFPAPPPSLDDLVDRFRRAITPRTKVILVCHITNLTGQIFPVREICRMGRERGIEVIVDGAHAFAHFPFTLADLDCDHYGTSLHKWLLAPHGTGFLYVRKEKIERLWPLMPAPP